MSKASAMQFAEGMRTGSAFLRDRCRELEEYSNPECPLPILLFGSFGEEVADNYDAITPGAWSSLLAMIEQGLASDADDVGTTGQKPNLPSRSNKTRHGRPGVTRRTPRPHHHRLPALRRPAQPG